MVDILKLGWVKILNFKFSGDADVLLMLSQDSEDEIRSGFVLEYDFGKMNSTLGSVVPLAMFLMSLLIMPSHKLLLGIMVKILVVANSPHCC